MEKVIKSERRQAALEYALKQIKNSPLRPYVQATFLYGSCSRGEEKYGSDVDLLNEVSKREFEDGIFKRNFKKMKLIDDFYFSTRYPGEDSVMLDSEDIEECKEAVEACRRETLEWINK